MSVDLAAITAVAGGAAGVIGAAVAVGASVGRPLRRLVRQQDEFREDWYGQPARPGRPAQSGVMERLSRIEGTLADNTLRDQVARLEQRLDDHLHTNGGGS